MSRWVATVVGDAPPPILARDQCDELGRRIFALLSAPHAALSIGSQVDATTNFARGDTHVATERASVSIALTVTDAKGRMGAATMTRLDDAGIKALVADAEAAAAEHRPWRTAAEAEAEMLGPQTYLPGPERFAETALLAMTPEARGGVFRAAAEATEAAGLTAVGDLIFQLSSRAVLNTKGLFAYDRATYGELSLTARTKDGRGSGWAWGGYEDWSRVRVPEVIARAVDLTRRSATPVAVEPGRYTVILEPAAVAALLEGRIDWRAWSADQGHTVFSKDPRGTNKIGLKMLDERLGIVADPCDPELPQSTIGPFGEPRDKVVWFESGVLRNLAYDARYAREKGRQPVLELDGFRLFAEGPTQTLEEMVASTKRGIWVNRLSHVTTMNVRTLMLTGTTRDGTFLIENGKITKAIKNFRFTESPFFVFNRVEAAGEPIRASQGVVAPRLKVRDFDFTSLTDAI